MYAVIELQTNAEGGMGILKDDYADINTAFNKFHLIMAAAAISKVEVHTAVILDETGNVIASGHFAHPHEEATE